MKPYVTKVVVCNPRKTTLLQAGNQSDRIDARKLAELLRAGLLSGVYHGQTGLRTLKEWSRSYLTISKDLTRTMNRLKALYRSGSIPCAGPSLYAPRHRAEWLSKITEAGVRRRAEWFYQQLDGLQRLRQAARHDLLAESRQHDAAKLLCQIPCIAAIRAALWIALIQTPHRFRTQRPPWAYSGLALETHSSGEYRYVQGPLQRSHKPIELRGLHKNHNHDGKAIFKGAAVKASTAGPFPEFYTTLLRKGMKPTMARLTVARKIATITWMVWKKGVCFDAAPLKRPVSVGTSRPKSPLPRLGSCLVMRHRILETFGFEGEYPPEV